MRKQCSQPIRFHTSKGLSILEIFVAITISMLLMSGILYVYINSKTATNMTNNLAQLQENERYVHTMISRVLRSTGYRTSPDEGAQYPAMSAVFPIATPFVAGTTSTGINGSDTLTIRFQGSGDGAGNPDGTIVDCLNNAVDANTIATNIFSLTANNELQCQAINPDAPQPNNTQILLSGVDTFKVLFGENLNGDYTANRYVPANFVGLNMANVVSLRVGFIMQSENPVSSLNSKTFYLLGTTYTPPNDERFRTQMVMTIFLRNTVEQPF